MSLRSLLHRMTAPASVEVSPVTAAPWRMTVSDLAVGQMGRRRGKDQPVDRDGVELTPWKMPQPPPGVVPPDAIAMDADLRPAWDWAMQSAWAEGVVFMGYPYLAELTQRSEYRRPCEILAEDMTRKWIRITSKSAQKRKGKEEQVEATAAKPDRVKELTDAIERHNVQAMFQRMIELDGYFGRSHLYVDVDDAWQKPDELKTPLVLDPKKIAKGTLRRFQVVEPTWVYPGPYNASDPLDPTFFRPQTWYVNARTVHHSRLMTMVSRPMPDIMKPAYAFGGVSLTQMMKPYVDNWLRTRQSVSDLVHSFSVMVLHTDLNDVLSNGGAETLIRRLEIFIACRDNRGAMAVDKNKEELTNVSAPLGTLDKLMAQAQEQMSAVTGLPLVVQFGISPSGLNASADPEIRIYYSWVHSRQEKVLRPDLQRVLNILQLDAWGEVDPDIGFEFEPLYEESAKDAADRRKTEADTDGIDIDHGALDPQERRQRLADDEDGPHHGIDADDMPEPPAAGSAEELELGGHLDDKDSEELDGGSGEPKREAA